MDSKQRVHEPFVFAAIFFALTAGFGYAAILVGAMALQIPLGAWWLAMVQAHGHAQLFGWAGLFVLGVGLFFLPRLRGTTLARPDMARYALACWVAGITLRALSQPLGAIPEASMPRDLLRAALAGSGVIELIGAILIFAMATATLRAARPLGPDAPIRPVVPFLAIAGTSFALAAILNAVLSITAAFSNSFLFSPSWDAALTHLLIYGFIIPLAIAMSVRNLPLFMRLATPPKRELLPLSLGYVTGLILRLAGQLEQLFVNHNTFNALGTILEGGALLAFIWMIDIPLRRKTPWIANRAAPPPDFIETRKPTRKNYPDYGEFGRFEGLVISAFLWLVLSAVASIINAATALLDAPILFNPDIERHAITVGFITLLIFGMAARMLPGFSGKSRVASTKLVFATFILGNLAAFCRVAPLFAPGTIGAGIAYGSSGAIGWVAVACLGVNQWRTFRLLR